jgi:hypothetical protein
MNVECFNTSLASAAPLVCSFEGFLPQLPTCWGNSRPVLHRVSVAQIEHEPFRVVPARAVSCGSSTHGSMSPQTPLPDACRRKRSSDAAVSVGATVQISYTPPYDESPCDTVHGGNALLYLLTEGPGEGSGRWKAKSGTPVVFEMAGMTTESTSRLLDNKLATWPLSACCEARPLERPPTSDSAAVVGMPTRMEYSLALQQVRVCVRTSSLMETGTRMLPRCQGFSWDESIAVLCDHACQINRSSTNKYRRTLSQGKRVVCQDSVMAWPTFLCSEPVVRRSLSSADLVGLNADSTDLVQMQRELSNRSANSAGGSLGGSIRKPSSLAPQPEDGGPSRLHATTAPPFESSSRMESIDAGHEYQVPLLAVYDGHGQVGEPVEFCRLFHGLSRWLVHVRAQTFTRDKRLTRAEARVCVGMCSWAITSRRWCETWCRWSCTSWSWRR